MRTDTEPQVCLKIIDLVLGLFISGKCSPDSTRASSQVSCDIAALMKSLPFSLPGAVTLVLTFLSLNT